MKTIDVSSKNTIIPFKSVNKFSNMRGALCEGVGEDVGGGWSPSYGKDYLTSGVKTI